MATRVEKGVYYPLSEGATAPISAGPRPFVRAKWNGEFRAPRAGEWFLSGAIVEAYEAFSDMNDYRHIVELVNTKDVHWVVTKGGKPLASLASENDAETWLMRHQGMSNDHAKRYEGYAITEVNNNG